MIFYDPKFVDADLRLRHGGHINRSDLVTYEFLCENFEDVARFYEAYGCKLVQHPDGFFFLLSQGSMIRSRLLPAPCVHLGLFIAMKMRDPEITRRAGRLRLDELLQSIEASVSHETLMRIYAPKKRQASANARITEEILRALRLLAELNFVELQDDLIRPKEAILRFAELARHNNEPDEAARLKLAIDHGVVFQEAQEEEALSEDDDEAAN